MKTERIVWMFVGLVGFCLIVSSIQTSAYYEGIGTGGGGGSGSGGGSGGGGGPLPPIPPSGHYTTDRPSASSYSGENSSGWSYATQMNGPSAEIWTFGDPYPDDYYYVSTGNYLDLDQDYGWSEQPLPPWNATILAVWIVAYVGSPEPFNFDGYLQYSLNAQLGPWGPALIPGNAFDIGPPAYPDHWKLLRMNVTAMETWTPDILLHSWTSVRFWTNDSMGWSTEIELDYIGLSYNWTVSSQTAPLPESSWGSSRLGQMIAGDWIIGIMGSLGFFGMMICPAVVAILARKSENRGFLVAKGIFAFMVSFALFIGSIGV